MDLWDYFESTEKKVNNETVFQTLKIGLLHILSVSFDW